jgi:hypothetical protein
MTRMADDRGAPGDRDRASLKEVRAAQLRARARRAAVGHIALGMVFLLGALSHALGPDPEARSSGFWMAALVVMSSVQVGLGLRALGRIRRRGLRLWPWAAAAWGVLATVVVRLLALR